MEYSAKNNSIMRSDYLLLVASFTNRVISLTESVTSPHLKQ